MAMRSSSPELPRPRAVAFWMTTIIIAAESAVGGVWDILRTEYVRDVLEVQLGYPAYVAIIIGICKIPGAAVLLAPGFARLKEWVYAGLVFIYTGAAASHLAVGAIAEAVGPLVLTAVTLASWALRPRSRRDFAAGSWILDRPFAHAMNGRAAVRWYWGITAVVVFVLLTGGTVDLLRRPETAAGVVALGYPLYFVSILGFWKLLGVAALLVPRFPRLKEWAYAGAFFNFAGAFVSHAISGSDTGHLIWTGVFSACAIVSWALRPHSRRALAARPSIAPTQPAPGPSVGAASNPTS